MQASIHRVIASAVVVLFGLPSLLAAQSAEFADQPWPGEEFVPQYWGAVFTPRYCYRYEGPLRFGAVERAISRAFEETLRDGRIIYGQIRIRMQIGPYLSSQGTAVTLASTWMRSDGDHEIEICSDCDLVEVLRHELAHILNREDGYTLPFWLEEGLAHFSEQDNGFCPELFGRLQWAGYCPLRQAECFSDPGERQMQLRAVGWAIVYYFHHWYGMSREEIAARFTSRALPPSRMAWAYIQDRRQAELRW